MEDLQKFFIERLKKGDQKAFMEIYSQYKDSLAYKLLKLVKSEELVQELLQDLFMKIWLNRDKIDLDKSFVAYIHTIAQNIVIDFFRRANKERQILDEIKKSNSEFYSHIEENLYKSENHKLLHDIINLLPKKRREVFVLCKLEGKSYKEVAELLGISVTTVNDHIQKASTFIKYQVTSNAELFSYFVLYYLFIDKF